MSFISASKGGVSEGEGEEREETERTHWIDRNALY
jgi:hypothetical protein